MKHKPISQILISSQTTRKQTRSSLTKVKLVNKRYKIVSYCALGAIGCANKTIRLSNYDTEDEGKGYNLEGDDTIKILNEAGVDSKSTSRDMRSSISDAAILALAKKTPYTLRCQNILLEELIIALNDRCRWSFKQIGDEMRHLEDKGVLTYGD